MLQNSLQYMTKKKGDISNRGLKLEIIKFILKNNGPIEEPIIRKETRETSTDIRASWKNFVVFNSLKLLKKILVSLIGGTS